ncbi:hypothetical protein Pst134EA_022796 [Puccinia striiformis f. sp. tritici]|uniref:hypothetical protein n=1 Tax=Puccinia striiformis f. sp. tritici TaxID=168172 RepID=UPI002007FFFF|nr:hypothetical protein Pst134EA_022796 [Puccinia striiformis f. sp. tritici]KAH9455325.1 hypothetical protein Pst134EA_022796 [Puccinia striiformis f. sp. tritici]
MLFYVYLISLIATITVIQAQTLPSATTCAKGSPISIKEKRLQAGIWPICYRERRLFFWSPHANSHSCGTCKITITKPSVALLHPSRRPVNVTIGALDPAHFHSS